MGSTAKIDILSKVKRVKSFSMSCGLIWRHWSLFPVQLSAKHQRQYTAL